MTTPSERFRALLHGAELLARLQSENVIPLPLRAEAARLALAYPRHDQLVALLKQQDARLPYSIAVAIFEVAKLFEECGKVGGTARDLQQLWCTTMRYYPSRADGWQSTESLEATRVADLLRWDSEV